MESSWESAAELSEDVAAWYGRFITRVRLASDFRKYMGNAWKPIVCIFVSWLDVFEFVVISGRNYKLNSGKSNVSALPVGRGVFVTGLGSFAQKCSPKI